MGLPMTTSSVLISLADPVITSLEPHSDELEGFPLASLAIQFGAFEVGPGRDKNARGRHLLVFERKSQSLSATA